METDRKSESHPGPVLPRLGGRRAWGIWLLTVVFVVFLFNVETMFSVVQGEIKSTLQLTTQQLTIIAGTYTWAFAVFQFFGGSLLDTFGSRKVLIPAFILVTLGVFIYGLAETYPMIILAQVVMALGACCGFVGAGYIGGVWFGMAAYGTMFGYTQTIVSASSAIQQPITNWLLEHTSYNHLFVCLGFFGLLLVVLAFLFMRNPVKVSSSGKNPVVIVFKDLGKIIKMPQIWIAAVWGGVSFGVHLAIGVVWAPEMYVDMGYTIDDGNIGSALSWAGLGIGSVFWPKWSDKIRNRKLPGLLGLLLMLVCVILVIYLRLPLWVMQIMMFLIGFGATAQMVSFMVGSDVAAGPLVGTSSAFLNAIMFICGGLMQNIPSMLEDKGHDVMFSPFVVAVIIGIIFVLTQKNTDKAK